jgi:hypothetical protein
LPKSFILGGVGRGQSSFSRQRGVCSQQRSGWVAVKFFLSLFFYAVEIRTSHSKKQLCLLICNFIDFDPQLLITIYFAFDVF